MPSDEHVDVALCLSSSTAGKGPTGGEFFLLPPGLLPGEGTVTEADGNVDDSSNAVTEMATTQPALRKKGTFMLHSYYEQVLGNNIL
mmetsp:Transcript_25680/g.53064  ORF Transcript_25680/g.53064 Transcript_25680/m.53064 type:complete len:87 (+) Transcript_25680:2030-2290(+)